MATAVKRGDSYKITASCGYDISGKQIRKHTTWTPPAGMTPRQIAKELERQKVLFEERVNSGTTKDGNIRFEDFAAIWMKDFAQKQLKIKTYTGYEKSLVRINQAIGHIKLKDLRTGHLNEFYRHLEETGIRADLKYTSKIDIGEAIKRMGARMGHHMIGDVHLGDWGLQMGLIIEELKDRGQKDFTLADLEEIYPAASAKSKEKDEATGKLTPEAEAFKERALHATSLLQNGDPECRKIWERIMELSLADLKKNYNALNVHFELWKGESDAQKYIPEMIQGLVQKGIAYESQGALVVDVQEESDTRELPPCLIRKSDGASLYATTDLATMVEREQLYRPKAYIYIADQRQSLHYTSFFRVAKKGGIVPPETGLTFLGFGTMNGKDGKPFKTREGGVMRLSVLIRDITDKVYEKIRETRSEEEIPEEEARHIAGIVGLAALKYGDLSNQASKDYVFDMDRFVSFEGNTGPYILYTLVRIGSILNRYFDTKDQASLACALEKAKADGVLRIAGAGSRNEKALALLLARYGEVMETAWAELAPHRLCQYVYEVSEAFNSFYHDTKILTEPDEEKKRSYLALLALTRAVLSDCIDVLGFSAPERM